MPTVIGHNGGLACPWGPDIRLVNFDVAKVTFKWVSRWSSVNRQGVRGLPHFWVPGDPFTVVPEEVVPIIMRELLRVLIFGRSADEVFTIVGQAVSTSVPVSVTNFHLP